MSLNHNFHSLTFQLVETVASTFGLGAAQPLGKPSDGARYLAYRLATPMGDFALVRPRSESRKEIVEKGISQDLAKAHGIILHLASRGFPVAAPMQTRNGSTVATIHGIPHVLYPYIDGQPMRLSNLRQMKVAGATLGSYHRIMTTYHNGRSDSEYFLPQHFQERLRQFRQIAEALGSLSSTLNITRTLDRLQDTLSDLETSLERLPYKRLPKVIIHGDYRSPNILFQGEKLAAIIDFHRSRFDARLLDIAITLSDLLLKGNNNGTALNLARGFVASYDKVQPLEQIERKALVPLTEARVAWRTLRRFPRLAKTQDRRNRLRRARRFRLYVKNLQWLGSTRHLWENMAEDL